MKPRTKRERQFVALAESLPELSDADKEWIKGQYKPQARLFNYPGSGYAYHCFCCGHVENHKGRCREVDTRKKWTCPECGAVCEVSQRFWGEEVRLVTKVDIWKGVQVFRTFQTVRRNATGSPTAWFFDEVFQNWIQPDGREVITSRPYTRGINFFNWYPGGEVGIGAHNYHCSGYYEWRDVFDVMGNYFLPRPRITGLLRRNGYRGGIVRQKYLNPAEAAKVLLCDSFAEELVKTGQVALFVKYVRMPGRFDAEKRAAVRICNRNGYLVKDATLWLDYLGDLVELGKDLHNPFYVCPPDLEAAHAKTTRLIEKKKEREDFERDKAKALEYDATYKEKKGRYFGIVFGDDKVIISVLTNMRDVLAEAISMHHCMFTHGYYKHENSVIMSARSVEDGRRLEIVEIDTKSFRVAQSRGLQNEFTKDHRRIIRLCNQNMDLFRKAKRAV